MNSFKKVSLIIAAALTSTMLVSTAANAAVSTTLTVGGSAAATTGATTAGAPKADATADETADGTSTPLIFAVGFKLSSFVHEANVAKATRAMNNFFWNIPLWFK